MPRKYPLDRSAMFSYLLTLSDKFGALTTRAGEHVVTEALNAWYDSTAVDMFAFTKEWIKAHRTDLLPLKA
jgi:hypothetical protein